MMNENDDRAATEERQQRTPRKDMAKRVSVYEHYEKEKYYPKTCKPHKGKINDDFCLQPANNKK